jgi:DNA-binding CsgD family transcriptional regulator
MNKSSATQFLAQCFDGLLSQDLESHLRKYHEATLQVHYQGKTFTFSDMLHQTTCLAQSMEKFHYHIEDLVVVDKLIISIVRFSWIHIHAKSYHEVLLNVVGRLNAEKITEIWLMIEQETVDDEKPINRLSFEVNQKDKADFLRRLSTCQYFYQGHWEKLTDSEKECLYYYLNGFSSKEAAQMMGLAYRTVEFYVANIKAKYACSTKLELRQKLFPTEKPGLEHKI